MALGPLRLTYAYDLTLKILSVVIHLLGRFGYIRKYQCILMYIVQYGSIFTKDGISHIAFVIEARHNTRRASSTHDVSRSSSVHTAAAAGRSTKCNLKEWISDSSKDCIIILVVYIVVYSSTRSSSSRRRRRRSNSSVVVVTHDIIPGIHATAATQGY